jgi:predicted TIM-barrel fold metal-dependent hydrolase
MFIDIHVHVRKRPAPLRHSKQAYIAPQQLIERYDKLGIERGVLLPGVNPECSVQSQSNEEVLEIAELYPDRFIPFCNIDPRAVTNSADAPLDELLNYYREMGCKGVGEVAANLPFLHPMVQNLFRHVQKVGLPLTFHIAPQIGGVYGLYDDPGLPQLERCLQLFPKLKFLGHSQPFWAEIGRLETPADRYGYPKYPVKEEGVVPKLMRRYQNLYGDLSAHSGYNALARDPEYAVQFLTEFQDRLLFGTDIVTPDTEAPLVDFLLKMLNEGQISEKVFRKIVRENALKILGL